MRNLLLLLVAVVASVGVSAQDIALCLNGDVGRLRNGDLLFHVQDAGNAITSVTSGAEGLKIDHVAIVHRTQSEFETIEAIRRGVVVLPIDSTVAMNRQNTEHVYVGRVVDGLDAEASVERAKRFVGLPYDFYFEADDSAIYCSELVQKAYVDTDGKPVFETIPMSFHDASGRVTPYWIEYYAKVGKTVPEGAPGTNPGQISRSRRVKIVYQLY